MPLIWETMRIVLSNSSSKWGGVHTVTENLVRGLVRRGHEVHVFGFPGGMLEERVSKFSHFEPILEGMDFNPRVLWRVGRALRRFHPDVVLTLMRKDTTMTALVAATMKIPVVVRHANDQPLRGGPYARFLYGALPTLHVSNAAATRRTILRSAPWLSADRIKVIYNGIDSTRFAAATAIDTELPAGSIAIGYVGSFERRKGVLELARAWPHIANAIPGAHLLLCGKGSRENEMRSLLSGAPRVRWLGYRKDIPGVLLALDMLILPSHVEGAPNIVLEAMASGVPIVATAVSGTPELMRDGIEGVLVRDWDSRALVESVIRVASDPVARQKMSVAGRRRVAEKFTLDAMLDSYEEMFETVVARAARGSDRPSMVGAAAKLTIMHEN